MDVPAEMISAFEEESPKIIPIEGVNGMDIGLDDSRERLVFRVQVSDPEDPPAGIPAQIGGFDVILIGGAARIYHTIPDVIHHVDATGGIQIGRRTPIVTSTGFASTGGCLGLVVRDSTTGDPLALSCAHVLCGPDPNGSFAVGDVIQQPAPTSLAPPASERLGELQNWAMPDLPPAPGVDPPVPSGTIDAAVCSIEGAFTGSEVEDVGPVGGPSGVTPGDPVKKRGPITGLTHGTVLGIFGWYLVNDGNGNPLWYMIGQISIGVDLLSTPDGIWALEGDSGSVVLNDADEVVGLFWGGDGSVDGIGYATDIFNVFNTLGLTMG